jgi:hypothetical protein
MGFEKLDWIGMIFMGGFAEWGRRIVLLEDRAFLALAQGTRKRVDP